MRGLILGFDGVLVHERPVHVELLGQVLASEGMDVPAQRLAELLGQDTAGGDQERIQALLDEFHIADGSLAPRLAARKAAFYQMRLRNDGHKPVEGASELVQRAHGAGWRLALLTPTREAEVESALRQLGIRDIFRTVAAGREMTLAAFQEVWRELNSRPPLPSRLLHPHEVIVLDSSPAALEAATGAGMVSYAITNRHPESAFAEVDKVIENLGELVADL